MPMIMRFTKSTSFRPRSSLRSQQRGVGLIEVLIALLVLSMGFLVSANMQLRGMRANQESFYHSQALMMANEMMDRMRNNRAGVVGGNYNTMSISDSLSPPSCASTGCDAAGMALLDRYEWSANLHNLRAESGFIPMLPTAADGTSATGSLSGPDTDGSFLLTMSWKRRDGENEVTESLPVRFVP